MNMNNDRINMLSYLREYELYALWKYANGDLTGRKVFQFADLMSPNASYLLVIDFLTRCFIDWGIKLEAPVFHKEVYLQYNRSLYEAFRVDLKADSVSSRSIQSIIDNTFNVEEIKNSLFLLNKYGISEFIEFKKALKVTDQNKIRGFLSQYITAFTQGELYAGDTNFLTFDEQKKRLLQEIQSYRERFGDRFVVINTPTDDELIPTEFNPYLFIHTLLALEKEGKITIDGAWVEDDVAPEKQTNSYKIKLSWVSSKNDALHQSKLEPLIVIEEDIGYFKFYKQGPKIKIGRKGTDKYNLLKHLLDPLQVKRTTESVFEAVASTKNQQAVCKLDARTRHDRMIKILQGTVKELQKIHGLKGRVSLRTLDRERYVLLEIK